MAELNKKSYRLLRYLVTIMLIAVLMTGATYGLQDTTIVANEFIGKPGVTPPSDTTVNVTKVWKPTNKHPDSVTVQLYRDGEPYGSPITLDAENNWTYRWTGLDRNNTWTVDEPNVPDGYTKEVASSALNSYIITNTQKTTKTKQKPDPPGNTQDQYPGIDTIGIPDEDSPSAGRDPNRELELPTNIPKTGDAANPRLWLIILAASTLMLRYVLFFRTKRKAMQNQK